MKYNNALYSSKLIYFTKYVLFNILLIFILLCMTGCNTLEDTYVPSKFDIKEVEKDEDL